MKHSTLILLCIFSFINSSAQDSTWSEKSFLSRATSIPTTPNKARIIGVTSTYVVGWTGAIIALNEIWYKGYPKSKFHAFDDSGEWLQVDKIGHAFSAYKLSQLFSSALQWSGIDKDRSVYIGAASGVLSQSVIEILDGYSAKWGFSWSDMGANVLGSGLYAGQHALWGDQRFKLRFSQNRIDYPSGMLRIRADDLYGASFGARLFKDYNAQTYWLSGNLRSFMPESKLPKWLNIAVGYGADGMYGGYQNEWLDENDNYINRTDIPRLRQFYIAPDIDFSRIETRSKFLNGLFDVFNLKLPLPTLEFRSDGNVKFHALYF